MTEYVFIDNYGDFRELHSALNYMSPTGMEIRFPLYVALVYRNIPSHFYMSYFYEDSMHEQFKETSFITDITQGCITFIEFRDLNAELFV